MAEERIGASFSIDTTNLKAGLAQANRLIRQSEAEFRAAASGIDKWAESEEGLQKRQKSLTEQIDIQKKKISALTSEKQRLISAMKSEGKSQEEIDRAIDSVNKQITSQSKALDRLQTELDRTTDALDDMGDEANDSSASIRNAGNEAERSSGGFTVLKGALANLVAEGFRKAIEASKEFATSMITTAAEVKAANSQFEQAFGDLEDEAAKSISNIAKSTGILETRLRSTGAGIYSFARSSGASTSEAMELMQEALVATADSAAYYDRSLEDSAETLQSFLKGNFANDAALGVSATEFTRNAKATELFGKKYNDLSEIEKQKTLLKMVTDSQKLSGAMGQAARESDGFENVMGNVNETMKQFKAKVGTPVLEALIPIIQTATNSFQEFADGVDWDLFNHKVTTTLQKIIEKGKELIPTIKEGIKKGKELGGKILPMLKTALKAAGKVVEYVIKNFDKLAVTVFSAVTAFKAFKAAMAVTAAITAAKTAVAGLATGVGIATKGQVAWNAAMSANPIGAVITAVALLAGGIAYLCTQYDKTAFEQQLLNENQRQAIDRANELAQSYKETKSSAEKLATAELANIDYTQSLWRELQTLTDENGKVKDGYEGRAQFILGQLNDALGTEYTMNDNIIQQYADMAKSIDTLIEKRKAQMLLDTYEETYIAAFEAISDAEVARATRAQELAAQQDKLDKARLASEEARARYRKALDDGVTGRRLENYKSATIGYSAAVDLEEQRLKDLEAAYNESDGVLKGYYADKADYEEASALVLEGETGKAIDILSRFANGFKTVASTAKLSAEEQKNVLQQQVIDTEVNAQLMEEAYANGVEGVSEEMVKTAKEQAEKAKEEFLKVGGDITKGIAEGAEGEEKVNWTLSGAMKGLIDKALAAARKAMDGHSPSRLFKREIGKNIGLGVAQGITQSTKDTVQAAKKQIKDIRNAYDLGDFANSVDVGINAKSSANNTQPSAKERSGVVVNQTNYYSQAHSRYELYKSKQQTAAAVRLAMEGV